MDMRYGAWLTFALALGSNSATADSLLDKPVREFIFHGKTHKGAMGHLLADGPGQIVEAFRNLADHAEVPIAIEALPLEAAEPAIPIEIDVQGTTVGAILMQMLAQDSRYTYRERSGIIEVLPASSLTDPANCLNMIIPMFIADADWNGVFQSLRCQIDRVSQNKELLPNPIRAYGCPGGSFSVLTNPPLGVIKMNFEHERVRDILDRLCTRAGNVAWHASFEGAGTACGSLSIHSYHPRESFLSEGPGPSKWSEGMPDKCISCHYHGK